MFYKHIWHIHLANSVKFITDCEITHTRKSASSQVLNSGYLMAKLKLALLVAVCHWIITEAASISLDMLYRSDIGMSRTARAVGKRYS